MVVPSYLAANRQRKKMLEICRSLSAGKHTAGYLERKRKSGDTPKNACTVSALDAATIQQRQALLAAAKVNLDYTRIVSPLDGIVVSRSIDVGWPVAASFQTPTLFLLSHA
jgi:multidrug resistance efflux pump